MNKSELITRMTERLGGDRAAAVAAVNGVLAEIEGGVARGERVALTGFGTFERRERAARTGRNPRTGEPVQVGPSVVPVFRAGAGFRSAVGGEGPARPAVRRAGRTVRIEVGEPASDESTRVGGKGKGKAGKGKPGKAKPEKGKGKAGKAKAAKKAAKG
ncbi:HU family DNA-binding protein [Blastococcus sp. SYSU D01042]